MAGKGGEGMAGAEDGAVLDRSLNWLLVVIAGVLLSFLATVRQREAAGLLQAGQEAAAARVGQVLPMRRTANLLITAALTFFFLLGLWAGERAGRSGDGAQLRSARLNSWASLLVLAAAVIRLIDVFEQELPYE